MAYCATPSLEEEKNNFVPVHSVDSAEPAPMRLSVCVFPVYLFKQ